MNTYDENALAEVVLLLEVRPCTVAELSRHYRRTPRTIKRWLQELRNRGERVVRDGIQLESPYAIVKEKTSQSDGGVNAQSA